MSGGFRAAGALAVLVLAAAAGRAMDDDLDVVRHALASRPGGPGASTRLERARWFKVRVLDKASGKNRVTVNLSLPLIRAAGDAWPDVRWQCQGKADHRCSLKVAQVLQALASGQELFEVDNDQQRIKVWIE
jgi:hypothetical protein